MKFRTGMLLVAALVGSCLLSKAAFAETTELEYADEFTTKSSGSMANITTFSWSEKPWLFLQLNDGSTSDALPSVADTWSTWRDPSGTNYTLTETTTVNGQWLSFSDALWNSIRKAGDWTLTAWSQMNTTTIDPDTGISESAAIVYNTKDTFTFKVLSGPEPISCGLFLLGGAALALSRKRKKV